MDTLTEIEAKLELARIMDFDRRARMFIEFLVRAGYDPVESTKTVIGMLYGNGR